MSLLEKLHKKIDESDWDVTQNTQINKAYQEVSSKLKEAGENDLLRKSEYERYVFAFSKSPEKGLASQISGTKELQDIREKSVRSYIK